MNRNGMGFVASRSKKASMTSKACFIMLVFTSGFRRDERRALLKKLEPLIKPPGFTGNAPGGPSRWSTNHSSEWQPLSPKLVVEVQYDHFTGNRFRHGTKFLRRRPDKLPKACSMDQVKSTGRAFAPRILTAAMTHKK